MKPRGKEVAPEAHVIIDMYIQQTNHRGNIFVRIQLYHEECCFLLAHQWGHFICALAATASSLIS